MLQAIGASKQTVANFQKQAELVAEKRQLRERDEVRVGSGYGTKTKKGHVEMSVNDELVQMDVRKAREIGLWLIESAEAAMSDEMFMKLLSERVGIDDPERLGYILLDLREIRQGTRGTSWPS